MIRSSSSALSPLAPPFTVPSYRYPPTFSELNGNGSFIGDESSSSPPVKSLDQTSSWIDPSFHYNASTVPTGRAAKSFIAYEEAYGTWHGNHDDPSARQVQIGADSATLKDDYTSVYDKKNRDSSDTEFSYFHLSDPNLISKECDTSKSNSAYDRYISQLVTNTSDSVAYYPPAACSSSALVFPPANKTSYSMYFAPRNVYPLTQHGTLLYDVDDNYLDYMLQNKKQPAIDQYSDGKDGYLKVSMTDEKMKGNNGTENSIVAAVCSPLGNEVTTDTKYGFITKHLNENPIVSSSRTSSLEVLDHPNQNEDSPCWKGASRSRKYSFCGGENVNHHDELKESECSDGLNRGQNCLPVGAQCMNTVPNISLSGTDKIIHNVHAIGLECADVSSSVINGKSYEGKHSERDPDIVNGNAKQSVQERMDILSDAAQNKSFDLKLEVHDHVRNFSLPGAVLDQVARSIDSADDTAKCLTAGKNIRLLLKAMHNMSEVLVLSSYNNATDWEECDHELVKLVMANLEAFASRNKKVITMCTSPTPGAKPSDNLVNYSYASNQKNEGNFHGALSYINKFDIERSQELSVKDLESNISENKEENPRALLYKKLWMQAEAALCSMKYELQVAHMKLEMQNIVCEKKAKDPLQVMNPPMLYPSQFLDTPGFTTLPVACNNAANFNENDAGNTYESKPNVIKLNKEEKVESSVMARLEVLRGRYARSCDINVEKQSKCVITENMFKDLYQFRVCGESNPTTN